MKEEFDLDSLKGAWQAVSDEKNYSTNEIFEMLKRKSITSVKWVFYISLIEILVAIGLLIYVFAEFGVSDYHQNLIRDYGKMAYVYEALNFFVYGVNFWFVYQFFKTYREIQVQSSVKDLSLDIIKFRNSIRNFIRFNIAMAFVMVVFAILSIWFNNPDLQEISLLSTHGLGLIVGLIVVMALFFGVMWLYYYLIYGTFRRRLKRNLNDLESLE